MAKKQTPKQNKKKGYNNKTNKKTTPQKSKSSTNLFPLVCGVITVGILARLLFPLFNVGMWHDECAIAINVLDKDFWGLFNPMRFSQVAPPLFLCTAKIFTYLLSTQSSMHFSDFILRLVPLAAGIGSIFAFYHLLKNIFFNKFVVTIGLILFALNPMLINYSYELKPFSTDVLICSLLLMYFVRYNPEGYWRQFIQILVISSSMLFSFPAFFIISGGLINILVKDWRKFLYAVSAFILFLTFYFIYHLWGIMEFHGETMDKYWAAFFINWQNYFHLILNWIKTNFNLFISPTITIWILITGFIISCFRDKKIAIITSTSIITLCIASYLHLYPFAPRMLLFFSPILIILVCEIFDLIPERAPISKITPFLFILLCCYNVATIGFEKFGIKTNNLALTLANNAQKTQNSIAISKDVNVEWLYYSRFFDFSYNRIFFQDSKSNNQEWFARIPNKNLYYFTTSNQNLPEKKFKPNSKILLYSSKPNYSLWEIK